MALVAIPGCEIAVARACFSSHNVPRCGLRIAATVFSAGMHKHAHHSRGPQINIFIHEYTQERVVREVVFAH